MQFSIVQPHPCSVTGFFDLLEGELLEARVTASSSSTRTELDARWEGEIFVRVTRIRPSRELPRVIARLLGPSGLSYVQTVRTDRATATNRWSLTVDGVTDRVRIEGIERVRPDEPGCIVTVDTTVQVRFPVIGGKVEQAVEREIRRVYARRLDVISDLHRT